MSASHRRPQATLLVALATLACSPEVTAPKEAEVIPGEPRPSVTFRAVSRFVDQAGQVSSEPARLLTYVEPPAALVPSETGGFRLSGAQRLADGSYVAPNVPEGFYFLRFNGVYLWTDARDQELVTTRVQRMDLDWRSDPGTAIALHVRGLAPWQSTDVLRLSAPNGDVSLHDRRLNAVDGYGGTSPTEGTTQLDANVEQLAVRLDATRGDSIWVQQLSNRWVPSRRWSYSAVVGSFHQPTFSLVPGREVPLDAVLDSGPERSVAFEVDAAAFEAAVQGVYPMADGAKPVRIMGSSWAIGGRPGAEPLALLGSRPELASSASITDAERAQFDVSFLDVFPAQWQRVMEVSSGALASFEYGGGTFQYPFYVVRKDTLAASLAEGLLAPRLGPVRNLRVNGRDASGNLTGVGITPVVSWDPPALGTPTRYFLELMTFDTGSGTFVRSRDSLVTHGTQLQLPGQVMSSGVPFVIKVTATRGAGTHSPHEGTLPLDLAEATTGLLTL